MANEKITFRLFQPSDQEIVATMIKNLYLSLGAEEDFMTDQKINATFEYLLSPQKDLWMEVFEMNDQMVGYALLFDYWYNEYGGKVLQLDELYILPEARGKGVASSYIRKLSKAKHYTALQLEVLKSNTSAWDLYTYLGFEEKETTLLYKIISHEV